MIFTLFFCPRFAVSERSLFCLQTNIHTIMSSEANVAKLMGCLDQAVEGVESLELQLAEYDRTLEVR